MYIDLFDISVLNVAASLGQVYKGRLRENGDLVAVKVQRPFVLETVTIDLYIIRKLGLVLRRFPQVIYHPSILNIQNCTLTNIIYDISTPIRFL